MQLAPHAEARLTAGGPVTNARAILRYALPIDNKAMAEVQKNLESISEALRIPGVLPPASSDVVADDLIVGSPEQSFIFSAHNNMYRYRIKASYIDLIEV